MRGWCGGLPTEQAARLWDANNTVRVGSRTPVHTVQVTRAHSNPKINTLISSKDLGSGVSARFCSTWPSGMHVHACAIHISVGRKRRHRLSVHHKTAPRVNVRFIVGHLPINHFTGRSGESLWCGNSPVGSGDSLWGTFKTSSDQPPKQFFILPLSANA